MKKGKYLVLDTETTGLSPSKCGLIQVAAVVLDKDLNILSSFVKDVKPKGAYFLDPEGMKINGFTKERIDAGISERSFVTLFMNFVKNNFDSSPVVVAHFWPFDFSVLERVFFRHKGCDYFNKDLISNNFIDTKVLINYINLKDSLNNQEESFPITSLSKDKGLKDSLGLNKDEYKAHDALSDVLATIDVLKAILQQKLL